MRASVLAVLSVVACGDGKPVVAPIVVPEQAPSPVASPSSPPVTDVPPGTPPSSTPAPAPAPSASADGDADTERGAPPAGSAGLGRLGGGFTGQSSPSLRQGSVSVTGKLPPEVVQRIVRQNFGRFRLCYENGLRNNGKLGGKVIVRFTITRAGDVSQPSDNGSDLPDKGVVACVVRAFANLSFPQPDAGTVVVVYPIIFAPP